MPEIYVDDLRSHIAEFYDEVTIFSAKQVADALRKIAAEYDTKQDE